MKRLVAIVLLCASSAFAQQNPRAPANVATRLYKDCLVVKMGGRIEITPTRVGIAEFIAELDDYCLLWTLIWYRALMSTDLPDGDVSFRFNRNRLQTLQSLTDTIRKEALR